LTVYGIYHKYHPCRSLGDSPLPYPPAPLQRRYSHAPLQFNLASPKKSSRIFGQYPPGPAPSADPQTARYPVSAALDSIGLPSPADHWFRRLRILLDSDILGRSFRLVPAIFFFNSQWRMTGSSTWQPEIMPLAYSKMKTNPSLSRRSEESGHCRLSVVRVQGFSPNRHILPSAS
jgi:hypothetical protein